MPLLLPRRKKSHQAPSTALAASAATSSISPPIKSRFKRFPPSSAAAKHPAPPSSSSPITTTTSSTSSLQDSSVPSQRPSFSASALDPPPDTPVCAFQTPPLLASQPPATSSPSSSPFPLPPDSSNSPSNHFLATGSATAHNILRTASSSSSLSPTSSAASSSPSSIMDPQEQDPQHQPHLQLHPPPATIDPIKLKTAKKKIKPRFFSGSRKLSASAHEHAAPSSLPQPAINLIPPTQNTPSSSSTSSESPPTSQKQQPANNPSPGISAFASISESIVNTFTFGSSHDSPANPLDQPDDAHITNPSSVRPSTDSKLDLSIDAQAASSTHPSSTTPTSRFPSVFNRRSSTAQTALPPSKTSKWKFKPKRRSSVMDLQSAAAASSSTPSATATSTTIPENTISNQQTNATPLPLHNNASSISLNTHMRSYPTPLSQPFTHQNRLSVEELHSPSTSPHPRRSSVHLLSTSKPASMRSMNADRASIISTDNEAEDLNAASQNAASLQPQPPPSSTASSKLFDNIFRGDFKNPFHRSHSAQSATNQPSSTLTSSFKFKAPFMDDLHHSPAASSPKKPIDGSSPLPPPPQFPISSSSSFTAPAAATPASIPEITLSISSPEDQHSTTQPPSIDTQTLPPLHQTMDPPSPQQNPPPQANIAKSSHSLFALAANFISDHTSSHSQDALALPATSPIPSNSTANPPPDNDRSIPKESENPVLPFPAAPPSSSSSTQNSIASTLKAPLSRIRRKTVSMLFSSESSFPLHNTPELPRELPPITPITPSIDIGLTTPQSNADSDLQHVQQLHASSLSQQPSPIKSDRNTDGTPSTPSLQNVKGVLSLHRTQSSQSPTRHPSQRSENSPTSSVFNLSSRPRSRTLSSLEQRRHSTHSGFFSSKYSESNLSSMATSSNNHNDPTSTNRSSPSPTSSPALPAVPTIPDALGGNSPRHSQSVVGPPSVPNNDPFSVPLPPTEPNDTPATYLSKIRAIGFGSNITGLLACVDDDFHRQVLKLFLNGFHFENDPLDMALRKFLISVKLPREAQQIDRVLEVFAFRYHECNPEIYDRPEDVYFFVFSLVLLQTDYFNPHNKSKMTKPDYLKTKNEAGYQNLPEEILGYFYDNITYTPFIHTDEDILDPGQVPRVTWARRTTAFGRGSREPLDPYSLLLEGRLDSIRPRISLNPDEDPYDFIPVEDKAEMLKLRQEFETGPSLQFISQRSRPDAFRSVNSGADDPSVSGPGVVGIKIVKAGYLYKCDAKRKNWRKWGVMLTASKLYIFKDVNWFQSNIMKDMESAADSISGNVPTESKFLRRPRRTQTEPLDQTDSSSQAPSSAGSVASDRASTSILPPIEFHPAPVIRPLVDGFSPTSVIVTSDMAALFYSNEEVKRNYSFLLIGRGGSREWYAGVDEADAHDWMKKINFAASFSTFFVAGMLGLGLIPVPKMPTNRMHSLRRNSESSVSTGTSNNPIVPGQTPLGPNAPGDAENATSLDASLANGSHEAGSNDHDQEGSLEKWGKKNEEEANAALAAIEANKDRHLERKSAVERRLEDITRQLNNKEKQVQEQVRTARHIQILAPILAKTRDSILQYAGSLSAKLDWNLMERKKLLCYQNFFTIDLEVETDLCRQLGIPLTPTASDVSGQSPTKSQHASSSSSPPFPTDLVASTDLAATNVMSPATLSPVGSMSYASNVGRSNSSPASSRMPSPQRRNVSLPVASQRASSQEVREDKKLEEEGFTGEANETTSNSEGMTSEESASFQSSVTDVSEEPKRAGNTTPIVRPEKGATCGPEEKLETSLEATPNSNVPESPTRSIDELSTNTLKEGPRVLSSELTSANTIVAGLPQVVEVPSNTTPHTCEPSEHTQIVEEEEEEPKPLPEAASGLLVTTTTSTASATEGPVSRYTTAEQPSIAALDTASLHTTSTVASSVSTAVNPRPSAGAVPATPAHGHNRRTSSLYSVGSVISASSKKTPNKTRSSSSSSSSLDNLHGKSIRDHFWSFASSSSPADAMPSGSEKPHSPGSPTKRSIRRSFSLSLRGSSRRNSINMSVGTSASSSPSNAAAAASAASGSPTASSKRMLKTLRGDLSGGSSTSSPNSVEGLGKTMSTRSLRKHSLDKSSSSPVVTNVGAASSPPNTAASQSASALAAVLSSGRDGQAGETRGSFDYGPNGDRDPRRRHDRGHGAHTGDESGADGTHNGGSGPGRSHSLVRKQGENITLLGKQFHVVEVNPEFSGPFNQHRRAVSQNFSAASLAFSGTCASPVTSNGTRVEAEKKEKSL